MYAIGLTGGIASGKSTVADYFHHQYGMDIVCADKIARQVMDDPQIIAMIAQAFGRDVIVDGEISRTALRTLITQDHAEKLKLDRITHPAIRKEIYRQVQTSHTHLTIVDIPLLSPDNIGDYAYLKAVIAVTAPLETRIARIMARDQSTAEEAKAMIARQPSDEARQEIADYLIHNDGDLNALYRQIDMIYAQIDRLANKST